MTEHRLINAFLIISCILLYTLPVLLNDIFPLTNALKIYYMFGAWTICVLALYREYEDTLAEINRAQIDTRYYPRNRSQLNKLYGTTLIAIGTITILSFNVHTIEHISTLQNELDENIIFVESKNISKQEKMREQLALKAEFKKNEHKLSSKLSLFESLVLLFSAGLGSALLATGLSSHESN